MANKKDIKNEEKVTKKETKPVVKKTTTKKEIKPVNKTEVVVEKPVVEIKTAEKIYEAY